MSPNRTSLYKQNTDSKSNDCVNKSSTAKELQERAALQLTSFFKCRTREPPTLPTSQTTPAPQLKYGLADQQTISSQQVATTPFNARKTPPLPLKPSRLSLLDDSCRRTRSSRCVAPTKESVERPLHTSCTGVRTAGRQQPAAEQAAAEQPGLQESLVTYMVGDATFVNIGDMPAYVVHKALTQHNGYGVAQLPISADQKCLQWLQGLYQ
ncbi:hypothetical protein LSAT2_032750 [Lamellibrachia satsuma]|nr:hypothetical protein LSAT2_032750 [Lamellibrachia satsuma]